MIARNACHLLATNSPVSHRCFLEASCWPKHLNIFRYEVNLTPFFFDFDARARCFVKTNRICHFCVLNQIKSRLGAILIPFWCHLDAILMPSWGILSYGVGHFLYRTSYWPQDEFFLKPTDEIYHDYKHAIDGWSSIRTYWCRSNLFISWLVCTLLQIFSPDGWLPQAKLRSAQFHILPGIRILEACSLQCDRRSPFPWKLMATND